MKILKIGIIVFGALGLVSAFMEFQALKLGFQYDKANTLMVLVGFAVPLVMGLMGRIKPPFLPWQAAASLAGFALCAIKFRAWTLLSHIMDVPTPTKLALIAVVGGVVVSGLALAKSETRT